jgi:CDP-diacylglycerol---serine O-phosphatidyltransferase
MKLFAIPNWFTLGNLFCGCLGIVNCFEGDLVWAAYLVGIAAVLDFLDGFMARLLKASSPVGKELDSLADMVTFGVLPGVMVFHLLKVGGPIYFPDQNEIGVWGLNNVAGYMETPWYAYFAFVISLFSALRLAKFNVDTRQSDSFIGVPTPAVTILIASLPLILQSGMTDALKNMDAQSLWVNFSSAPGLGYQTVNPINAIILHPWFLLGLTAVMSFLLISEIPLFALKFKKFGWKGNEIRYIFLALSVLLFVFFWYLGIALIIVLYVLMSVVNNLLKKKEPQA